MRVEARATTMQARPAEGERVTMRDGALARRRWCHSGGRRYGDGRAGDDGGAGAAAGTATRRGSVRCRVRVRAAGASRRRHLLTIRWLPRWNLEDGVASTTPKPSAPIRWRPTRSRRCRCCRCAHRGDPRRASPARPLARPMVLVLCGGPLHDPCAVRSEGGYAWAVARAPPGPTALPSSPQVHALHAGTRSSFCTTTYRHRRDRRRLLRARGVLVESSLLVGLISFACLLSAGAAAAHRLPPRPRRRRRFGELERHPPPLGAAGRTSRWRREITSARDAVSRRTPRSSAGKRTTGGESDAEDGGSTCAALTACSNASDDVQTPATRIERTRRGGCGGAPRAHGGPSPRRRRRALQLNFGLGAA